MLMIPLPFVIAMAAAILFLRELLNGDSTQRNHWWIGFLGLFIFQEILIGLRFGYGMEWLRTIQPISAALIPPLAYLGFRRPQWSFALLIHALPVLGVLAILFLQIRLLDAVLAANNVFYAGALIRLGLRGSDALDWVEIRRLSEITIFLWLVVGVLIVSGLTDAIIVYDFFRNSGANTGNIAGWATALGTAVTMLCFAAYKYFGASSHKSISHDDAASDSVFIALDKMMKSEKLHLDADINLSRIARRMMLPARDVSRAVNRKTMRNVSQYINHLRIEEACTLLEETDVPITQIVFAAGFNTKSNFNREFQRIKDKSPSEWRGQARTHRVDHA